MRTVLKAIKILILTSFLTPELFAQTCNWIKLGPAGSINPLNSANNYSLANGGTAFDKLGNVVSVSANYPLCGGGNTRYDYFLSKYDPDGNLLWRHKFTNGSAGADVTIDGSGNIYVVSSYFSDMDGVPSNLDNNKNYLLKFSPSGILLWYKSYGPVIEMMNCFGQNRYQRSFLKYHEGSNSLVFYTSPYFFNSTFPFLDTTINAIPHPAGTSPADLLISRIDTSGARIWTRVFRNDSTLKAGSRGLDFNNQNQLVISGFFEKYMRFGDTTLYGTPEWYNVNGRQPFVALLNFSDGQFRWAKKMTYTGDPTNGGNVDDYITPVAITESGRIGLVHAFNDTLITTPFFLMRNYKLVTMDDSVIKHVSALISGTPDHSFYGMCHYGNNFYLAGGSDYPILAKYDTAGNSLFYKKILNSNNNASVFNSIVVDEYKNIFAGSSLTYYSPATTITLGCATLSLTPGYYKFEWTSAFSDRGNIVRGTIFRDANSNGIKDASENILPNVLIRSNTGSYAFTNQNGEYSIFVGQGAHIITTDANIRYHIPVPANHAVNFPGLDQLLTGKNFAFQPIPGINDLEIDITPLEPRARVGFPVSYQVTYKNNGTTTLSDVYALKLPQQFLFVSSDSIPSYISPDSLRFNFTSLQPYDIRHNTIRGTIAVGTPVGTMIKYKAYIYPIVNDTIPADNIDSVEQEVRASYDPNCKIVFPTTEVLIDSINQAQQSYEYTLMFQNTGNDTAFTVRILDTLSDKLNLSTFDIVAYSHPVSASFKDIRLVEFRFNNILLPDSNVNEPASHGFVKFRIKPKTTSTVQDTIFNSCSIYFDYNSPVVTNTTVTSFRSGIVTGTGDPQDYSKNLKLFPNPAHDEIVYELTRWPVGQFSFKIYDINGRLLYAAVRPNTGISSQGIINISFLSPGTYILEAEGKNTRGRKKIIKL